MPRVRPNEYNSAAVRLSIRRARAERRTRTRSRWWFPLVGALLALAGCWGLLKADQVIADELIWPSTGAQFVEVGPLPADPAQTGDRITIVVAGLNRKDGTGVAAAVMPSLTAENARMFSLVYGSGISDNDILEKYDALIGRLRPQEVSFFGSSMGGDVVLRLAAHTQQLRSGYVADLLVLTGPSPGSTAPTDSAAAAAPADRDRDRDLAEKAVGTGAADTKAARSGADGSAADGSAASNGVTAGWAAGFAATGTTPGAAGTDSASAMTDDDGTAGPPPRLGTIFLDCSPLDADDVRDSSRTRADALTAVMEATDTEGGAAVRMAAEVLGQQQQWSSGRFPFLQVRTDDLTFKINQVWQQKISAPGISTQLIKDQYGVIRRTDITDIAESFLPGTRIVYFLPENRRDDRTVRVERAESTLRQLAEEKFFDLRIVEIPDGHHASAESNADIYRQAIDAIAIDPA